MSWQELAPWAKWDQALYADRDHIYVRKKYERQTKDKEETSNWNESLGQAPFWFFLIRAVPFLLMKRLSDPLKVWKCQYEMIISMEGLLNSPQLKGKEGKKVTKPKKGEIVVIPNFLLRTNLPYLYEKYLQTSL